MLSFETFEDVMDSSLSYCDPDNDVDVCDPDDGLCDPDWGGNCEPDCDPVENGYDCSPD